MERVITEGRICADFYPDARGRDRALGTCPMGFPVDSGYCRRPNHHVAAGRLLVAGAAPTFLIATALPLHFELQPRQPMATPEIVEPSDLWNKVQATRFVLLTTAAADGSLTSRPMTIQRIDEPGTVLFFASLSSPLVQGLKARPDVNVGVADPHDDFYVSIEGRAVISNDRALIKELWSPLAKAWFPGGVDDEDLVLIEIMASQAEYWNVRESEMVQFFKMAKAAFTGTPPTDLGEHGTIDIGGQPRPTGTR